MSNVSLVPGSPEWQTCITASKIAAIMGASTYDSPTSIWHQLAGKVEHDVSPPSDAQFRGTMMEPYVLAYAWQRRHPDWSQSAGETTWTRDDLPFPAAANTDSHGVKADGTPVIIESKTVGDRAAYDQWGEEGDSGEIPDAAWWQVHFQMFMSGIREVRIEVCGPRLDEHREYIVIYDPSIASFLRAKLTDFYASIVLELPPKVDGHEATVRSYRRAVVDIEESNWEIAPELAAALEKASADEKNALERKREAQARILQAMGTAKYATVDGVPLFRRQKSGKGVALYPVKPSGSPKLAA